MVKENEQEQRLAGKAGSPQDLMFSPEIVNIILVILHYCLNRGLLLKTSSEFKIARRVVFTDRAGSLGKIKKK